MLNITPFRQKPGYCGPASLKMVLGFYGIKITERKLVELSGCTEARGVGAQGLVKAAQALGFRARIRDGSDLKDISEYVNRRKIPVIVDWFAFDGGHYSVVSGIDKENIYLEDPSLGYRRAMKLSTFKRLWFDFPNDYLKSKSELIIRRMIAIDKCTRYDRLRDIGNYCEELRKLAANRRDTEIKRHRLKYRDRGYDFYRIASKGIGRHDKVMIIRAGIHGDEIAGPLTVVQYFNRIFDYAHKRGVKLVVYPLGNPSGFDARQRYNIEHSEGSGANNDFLRYELDNGKTISDIGRGTKFRRWYWSSDSRLKPELPAETVLMHELLKRESLENIVAALDLHQDHISAIGQPAAYHYAFGDLSVYNKIIDRIKKIVPVIPNKTISAGQTSGMRTNKEGFIVRHDGTLGDLFFRLGVKYPVTAETTGKTPLDKACQVNWLWVKGLIDLSAHKDATIKRPYTREVTSRIRINIAGHRILRAGRVRSDIGTYPIYAIMTKNYRKDLPRMILSAGIHGEEPAGVYALLDFLNRDIVKYLNRFSFLILPCLNPYGFTRGTRGGLSVPDINRAFDNVMRAPEAAAVGELLHRYPGPYRLTVDCHETDTYMPEGDEPEVEGNPAGFYMYETTRTNRTGFGPGIIRKLRNSGFPISKRRSIYGANCRNGLITSSPPGHPDYPALPEFNGTLDWYLLKNGYTDHILATETPTAWPFKQRVAAHKKALTAALDSIKREG